MPCLPSRLALMLLALPCAEAHQPIAKDLAPLVGRILGLEARAAREGALHGLLELPGASGAGPLAGVLTDEAGDALWKLVGSLTRHPPQGNQSARFEYGSLRGELAALSAGAAPLHRAYVQGEWARFGPSSPKGELVALVYEMHDGLPQVLGTLRAVLAFDATEEPHVAQLGERARAEPLASTGALSGAWRLLAIP